MVSISVTIEGIFEAAGKESIDTILRLFPTRRIKIHLVQQVEAPEMDTLVKSEEISPPCHDVCSQRTSPGEHGPV